MAQKLLNTRIGLKYDSYSNWTQKGDWSQDFKTFTPSEQGLSTFWAGFTPLKGEVCFFEIPAENPNPKAGSVEPQEPAILFKVGDGQKTLLQLPWGQAIAADVYSWAKQQSLLGGQYESGTGWDFTHATSIQDATQDEVGGFIGKLVKIKVTPVAGQDNTYVIEVSTDGGIHWTPSGQITMTTETYLGDDTTISIDGNNTISVIPAELDYTSGNGIDIGTPGGVLTADDVDAIEDFVNSRVSTSEVTVEKLATATSGYASSYIVKQNGVQVGDTIDIPKDFLVKSATLEVVDTPNVPYPGAEVGDKYIDFVINAKDASATDEHIYLPVKDLVDVYTGGTTDYITVSIDGNNEITADFNNGVIVDELNSGTGEDTIPTSEAVMDYVQSQISSATPNIEEGDGIDITDGNNTKTISVKLDETNSAITDNAGSGLVTSSDGLRIDDSIVWVWQCGGAENNI